MNNQELRSPRNSIDKQFQREPIKPAGRQVESRGLTLSTDYGERFGGVYILVEGVYPIFIYPSLGQSPKSKMLAERINSLGVSIKFDGPPNVRFFREYLLRDKFPEVYEQLSRGEPVTSELLSKLPAPKEKKTK